MESRSIKVSPDRANVAARDREVRVKEIGVVNYNDKTIVLSCIGMKDGIVGYLTIPIENLNEVIQALNGVVNEELIRDGGSKLKA